MGACAGKCESDVKSNTSNIAAAKTAYTDHKFAGELTQLVDDLESKGEGDQLVKSLNEATDVNLIVHHQQLLKSYYDPLVRAYDPKRPHEAANAAINKYGGLLGRCDAAILTAKENQVINQHRSNIMNLGRFDMVRIAIENKTLTSEQFELLNKYYEPFYLQFSASTNPTAQKCIEQVQPVVTTAQDLLQGQGAVVGGKPKNQRANSLPSETVTGNESAEHAQE